MSEHGGDWETRHAHYFNLPPFEAWKEPEKWLAYRDGRIKRSVPKFEFAPDERGFIDIHNVVRTVSTELFHPEYQWVFNPSDILTAPDDHHFYYDAEMYRPANNRGSEIPWQFRNLPVNVGRLPRQFHNVLHTVVERHAMPEMDAMAEFVQAYTIAHQAFKRLFLTAKQTTNAAQLFSSRKLSLETGSIIPIDAEDSIAEAFMRDFFDRHFRSYSEAIDAYIETDNKEIVYQDHETLKVTRPPLVVRKLGSIVNRKSVVIRVGGEPEAA
jgi:hypothetical protein